MKHIGIFGGTFDPVHNGHLAIADSFLNSDTIDELWIMVTPESPHKQDQKVTAFSTRLLMTRTAFSDNSSVLVRDDELSLPKPSYTWRTLTYLRQRYSDKQFSLCLGEDSLASFDTWFKFEQIIEHTSLLVARRPDSADIPDLPKNADIHYVSHEPVDISSSEIRERVHDGKKVSDLVPNDVLDIIIKQDLYT